MNETCLFVPKLYNSERIFVVLREAAACIFIYFFPHQVQLGVVSAAFSKASIYL